MDIDSPPSPHDFEDPHSTHHHLQLPGFSASFPLPFRVLFLIGLAQLLWAVNLHVLHILGLDTSWVLDLRLDPDKPSRVALAEEGEMEDGVREEEDGAIELVSPSAPRLRGSPNSTALGLDSGPGSGEISLDDRLPDTPVRPSAARIVRPPSGKLYQPVYKLFLLYTAWCGSGWVLFRTLSQGDHELMEKWRIIPGLLALGVLAAVLVPWRGVAEWERAGLRRAMKRILLPPLNAPIFFCDVILADILTSFAKVLGDMWISAVQIWVGDISKGRVGVAGYGRWVTLAMVSLPYLLRFRQCLLEYYQSSWSSPRPLANALKYFSAFPVIFLSAAQKSVVKELALAKGISVEELGQQHDRWFGEHRLFRLWLLAVCVNSMFSFYWDVEKDWGLALCEVDTWLGPKGGRADKVTGLLSSPVLGGVRSRRGSDGLLSRMKRLFKRPHTINHQRSPCPTPVPGFASTPDSPSRPSSSSSAGPMTGSRSILAWGLRPILLLPDPLVYHLFTLIDLVLRFTWSLKLSTHLHTISEIESGVFMMEALELIRRWMWVFVRVEWEAVKMGEVARFGRAGGGAGGGGTTLWEEKPDDR
ncbi:hypothetical protein IAU60_001675 [Kwoniella sp. DSM 27419]